MSRVMLRTGTIGAESANLRKPQVRTATAASTGSSRAVKWRKNGAS